MGADAKVALGCALGWEAISALGAVCASAGLKARPAKASAANPKILADPAITIFPMPAIERGGGGEGSGMVKKSTRMWTIPRARRRGAAPLRRQFARRDFGEAPFGEASVGKP